MKRDSKQKWNDSEYHVKDNGNVTHATVKNYCATNQFPALKFCDTHIQPHGVLGSSKYYNFNLDPKLGHGKYAILWIPCACVTCTNTLDKNWDPDVYHARLTHFQPVMDCA